MWEQQLLRAIHSFRTPTLDEIAVLTTPLGNAVTLLAVVACVALLLVRNGRSHEARVLCIAALVVSVLNWPVKSLFARPRPDLWLPLVTAWDYAFPSGHALGTAAIYPLVAVTLTRPRSWQRHAAVAFAVFASFVIGLGRLYIGVHWPTDVLAGWAIGAAIAVLSSRMLANDGRDNVTSKR